MADLIIGSQGTGKSYRAVKKIFDERDKYIAIYTNINELKIEGNIHKLNFTKFINDVISPLYSMFIADNNISDSELNNKLNEILGIDEGLKLIIVDEAQNFFNKKNDVINWLVTYHRHFDIELILISQLVKGIHSDHAIFNNVYEALNTSKQFIPNVIRYKHYMGLPANSTNYLKRSNLTIDPKVFTLYGSGGKVSKKNPLIIPILLLFVLLVLVFYGFSYALTMFDDKTEENNISYSKVPAVNNVVASSDSSCLVKNNDVKISSAIYSYFVDEQKMTLECENDLIVPLHFAPKPRFKTTIYNSLKYYYYLSPLKYCMIVDNNVKDDVMSVSF